MGGRLTLAGYVCLGQCSAHNHGTLIKLNYITFEFNRSEISVMRNVSLLALLLLSAWWATGTRWNFYGDIILIKDPITKPRCIYHFYNSILQI